jgi:hypothetical protein
MTKSTVIDFARPSDFSPDPLLLYLGLNTSIYVLNQKLV